MHLHTLQVVRALRFDGVKIPEGYERRVQRALWTFKHQRVYCPRRRAVVHLHEVMGGELAAGARVPAAAQVRRVGGEWGRWCAGRLCLAAHVAVDAPSTEPCLPGVQPLQLEEGEPDFLGPPLPDDVARAIAVGACCCFACKFQFYKLRASLPACCCTLHAS